MRLLVCAVLGVFSVMATASAQSTSETLVAGGDIKTLIEGRRIYLKVPAGGEFPLYYRPGGVVDGTGQAAGLGIFARVSDEGKWWVSGDQLCQQWQTYENGKRFCFHLFQRSDGQLSWHRDDGLKGLARIGR